jgi:hypothetical protein
MAETTETRTADQMTITSDDLFLMANLNPRLTGLPFVVWISPRGNARHDVRVKVSPGPRAQPTEMVSVGLRPEVHVVEGTLKAADLELLRQWVALNLDVLVRYWDGDIEFTDEAMDALRSI